MAKLPVTVLDVETRSGGSYAVRVAYYDGTTGVYLIPATLATVQGVTISALAMAVLSDNPDFGPNFPGPSHRRYRPRP